MANIFHYDFMIRAFVAGLALGIITPVIGSFLVVRRFSLIADTLAHVSLLGVAAGLFININPLIGAFLITIIAAFIIEELRQSKSLNSESVLAIILSGSLALALILIGLSRGFNLNIMSYLFGSIATVNNQDILVILILTVVEMLVFFLIYRQLFMISLDEETAKASGINVKIYNLLFINMTAVTIVLSLRIVGVLLIGALMVIPAVAAQQYKVGFLKTVLLAVLISLLSIFVGLIVSFYMDLPSGATIVIVALSIFTSSYFANLKKV